MGVTRVFKRGKPRYILGCCTELVKHSQRKQQARSPAWQTRHRPCKIHSSTESSKGPSGQHRKPWPRSPLPAILRPCSPMEPMHDERHAQRFIPELDGPHLACVSTTPFLLAQVASFSIKTTLHHCCLPAITLSILFDGCETAHDSYWSSNRPILKNQTFSKTPGKRPFLDCPTTCFHPKSFEALRTKVTATAAIITFVADGDVERPAHNAPSSSRSSVL